MVLRLLDAAITCPRYKIIHAGVIGLLPPPKEQVQLFHGCKV